MTANEMQQKIEELEARLATATPRASGRSKAPVVVIDGTALMDQPDRARPMTRLTSASRRNLTAMAHLRLRAMGIDCDASGVELSPAGVNPPYVTAKDETYAILYGPGDATDYYFRKH